MKAVEDAIKRLTATFHFSETVIVTPIIERACLEAQLELLREIASHSEADVKQGEFTSELIAMGFYTDKALTEIEAKLKAMK